MSVVTGDMEMNSNPPFTHQPYQETSPAQHYPPQGGFVSGDPYQQAGGPPPYQRWQAGPAGDKPTYDGSDASDTDPEDNENSVPAYDPPPDVTSFESPPGYGQIGTDAGAPLPPPMNPLYQYEYGDQRPAENFKGVTSVEDDKVRDAIYRFADNKCCYGTGAAENMTFTNTADSSALHYQLETFTEERRTCWKHEPHRGGYVDVSENGRPPAVWDIVCEPNAMFETHTKRLEVPHTSKIKECHGCCGRGYRRCHRCHGRGRVRCSTCHGSGRRRVYEDGDSHYETCHWCGGDGRRRCTCCGGDGRVICHTCDGYCRLRWYIDLTIKYTNNVEDYIHETTDMPDELIRDVSGEVVLEQTLPYVRPITKYHVPAINVNSTEIVEKHQKAWPNTKMLQQRQVLRSVPVTEVQYLFKEKDGRFWVYGNEYEVHFPDYPHNCCWGCVII